MKLYIIIDASEAILGWAGTVANARAAKKARVGAKEWREIEVPTNKVDLLAFLNNNFVSQPPEAD